MPTVLRDQRTVAADGQEVCGINRLLSLAPVLVDMGGASRRTGQRLLDECRKRNGTTYVIPTDLFKPHDWGTPWQQANNYATNTLGSWNYRQSPYCSVQECYNTPVISLLNRSCWCEKHLPETDPAFPSSISFLPPVYLRVESRTGAVALVFRWLVSRLSPALPQSGLAWLCFLFPLIEPNRRVSRIRLSEKVSRGRPRKADRSHTKLDEPKLLMKGQLRIRSSSHSGDRRGGSHTFSIWSHVPRHATISFPSLSPAE